MAKSMLGTAPCPVYRAGMADPALTDADLELLETPRLWFRLFNEIGIINQLSVAQLERVLAPPLKFADFRLLNHFVRLGGPRTPIDLARAFQVTKGTMTHTLQKMDGLGLIAITPHADDARSKLIDITEKGREAHGEALVALLPEMESVVTSLDPAVLDALKAALPALTTLRETLDKARN